MTGQLVPRQGDPTSGVAIFHGAHAIRCFSRRQATVALSSGEAELYAINHGAREAIGIQQLALELGIPLEVKIYTDASAVVGIVHRVGSGRLKHVSVQELWLQQHVGEGRIQVKKIGRERNLADYLTKHWDARNGMMIRQLCDRSGPEP